MGVSQSNLSAAQYGYDFVVAVTQESINATMKEYLAAGTMPVANICYVADANGNPTPIDYETLKQQAKGSDPFAVPDGADPATSQDLINLMGARFMVGFRAQIGLPGGYAPTDYPDVVTLGANTAAVVFRLMCSQFTVVQLVPGGGYNPPSWMNRSQPDGDAWLFTSQVDLRMFPTDQSAYDNLPPAVQAQIQALGAAPFSVQQLLFDLDNAALQTVPVISGVQPGTPLYTVLQTDFLGTYFAAMQTQGSPLLGATVTMAASDPSTLVLSNLNMEVSPLLNPDGTPIPIPTPPQQALATLNYLCEADNDPPLAATQFNYNWVDAGDQCDGVLAINRDTFASYFETQLTSLVSASCYAPWVRVSLSGIFDQDVNYYWSMTPNQPPTITRPPSGSTVLQYSFSGYAEDDAGAGGDMGHLTLAPAMNVTVQFTGNTIVVTQHLVVYLYVKYLATGGGGNVVDITITDTYTLAVDSQGKLTATLSSNSVDNSENPSSNPFLNWFADVQSIIDDVETWIRGFVGTNFQDMPLSVVQDFVFPGGNTFVFNDITFSDNQDLVGRITYADPTQIHLVRPEMLAGPRYPKGVQRSGGSPAGSTLPSCPPSENKGATASTPAYQVTISAELMDNYLQSDVLDPQDRFIALQTDRGASLLFSVGTDGAFWLTGELQGEAHGWARWNLSDATARKDFGGMARCATFVAAQKAASLAPAAEIHLAMVLDDGTNAHLYISLNNPDDDTGWAAAPAWSPCPFNALDGTGAPIAPPSPFRIAGVFISEASDGEYVVVDIVRNPGDPAGYIERFYLDVSNPAAPQWHLHDVAADIDVSAYSSALGRKAGAFGVDGIYTLGNVTGLPQLLYTPLLHHHRGDRDLAERDALHRDGRCPAGADQPDGRALPAQRGDEQRLRAARRRDRRRRRQHAPLRPRRHVR